MKVTLCRRVGKRLPARSWAICCHMDSVALRRWSTAPDALRVTLWMLLTDLPPAASLLLLATADVPLDELPADHPEVREIPVLVMDRGAE